MSLKTVYTVIAGKGYKLREPEKVCHGWQYVCYTDQSFKSDVWETRALQQTQDSSRRRSRVSKIAVVFNGVSIYMDAKFRPVNNLDYYVEKYLDGYDMAIMSHPKRNCLYKESTFLTRTNIEKWENIQLQLSRYINQGFPKEYGLWAPGIMIRRDNETVRDFCGLWWNEYISGTERDMISLAYTIWKTRHSKIKINVMPFRKTYKRFRI